MTGRDGSKVPRGVSANLFLAALLLAGGMRLGIAQTTLVRVGDALPQISGQTLSGKQLTLPADAGGKPAVVAFSFSKAGGRDSGLWSDHVEKDFPAVGYPYTLMMIEAAPKFVRGMIISGSKKGMSPAAQDRCIAMEKDEDIWKQRIGFTKDDWAYVFLLGPDGRIRWRSSSAFTDAEYAALKKELAQMQP
jgi:ATP10 protein